MIISSKKRVLVIEDEAPKRRHLTKAILDRNDDVEVLEAPSVKEALKVLHEGEVQVIVLDMSLPTFTVSESESGGRPQAFGGIEILRNMVLEYKDVKATIVTGFEAFEREGKTVNLTNLTKELKEEFGDMLNGVVYFDSTVNDWRDELNRHLAIAWGE